MQNYSVTPIQESVFVLMVCAGVNFTIWYGLPQITPVVYRCVNAFKMFGCDEP